MEDMRALSQEKRELVCGKSAGGGGLVVALVCYIEEDGVLCACAMCHNARTRLCTLCWSAVGWSFIKPETAN